MFTYFHTYIPETWDEMVKQGFVDKNSGVRFCNSCFQNDDLKFNALAAKGTKLYNIIKDANLPLYIDRLQGGIFYSEYNFDRKLIEEYKEMGVFWGLQMHEWMSNYMSDLERIRKNLKGEWAEKSITESVKQDFDFNFVFVESMSVKEHAEYGNPKTIEEFLKAANNMFLKRMRTWDNMLIPCDSMALALQTEVKSGAKYIMSELGAQTPNARIQMAYARGVARTNNVKYGIYYEPWGGKPFGSCCYQRELKNEWGCGNEDFPFVTMGENGGSSRSLQKRIHLYSYFSGAQFMAEEWGGCNTFCDWQDFEISDYGKVKLDFLKLIRKYPHENIGVMHTPVAVVLPDDVDVLPVFWDYDEEQLMHYPIYGKLREKTQQIQNVVRGLMAKTVKMHGCPETETMINSDIPDAIDIVHKSDADKFDGYEYFINLSDDKEFEKTHKCINTNEAENILKNIMPCTVEGGVHWFVNRKKDSWVIVIFNNDGVDRSVEMGERFLAEGDRTVKLMLKNGQSIKRLEGADTISGSDGVYNIEIKSGDWFMGEFSK